MEAWLDASTGAVIAGRWTYEAAGHWGAANPWGLPFYVVTHRPEEQPPGENFIFVGSVPNAIDEAKAAAGDEHVHLMGGADVTLQAPGGRPRRRDHDHHRPGGAGGGKRPFEGFTRSLDLEHLGVRQSPFATFIDYRVNG